MPAPIVTLFIAATPLIVRWLQTESARDEAEAEQREREIKIASDTIGKVAGTTNRLLYVQREAMFGAVFDRSCAEHVADDAKTWSDYRVAMGEWAQARVLNEANVESYFGKQALTLLCEINDLITTLDHQVQAAHYGRSKSRWYLDDGGENDFRVKFMPLYDEAEDKLGKLSTKMIRALQDGRVGSQLGCP
jgi:hypothetical protein